MIFFNENKKNNEAYKLYYEDNNHFNLWYYIFCKDENKINPKNITIWDLFFILKSNNNLLANWCNVESEILESFHINGHNCFW